MECARFTIQTHPVPIEYSIRRIGVLLNLKDHQARPNCVDPAPGQEHHIPSLYRNTVETSSDVSILKLLLKPVTRHTPLQANIQFGPRFSVGDVPHLSFRLSAQFFRLSGWRMDLERKFLSGVQ